MLGTPGPIFAGQTMELQHIRIMIDDLKQEHEPKFKQGLKEWIGTGVYEKNPGGKENAELFINADYRYFTTASFIDRHPGKQAA